MTTSPDAVMLPETVPLLVTSPAVIEPTVLFSATVTEDEGAFTDAALPVTVSDEPESAVIATPVAPSLTVTATVPDTVTLFEVMTSTELVEGTPLSTRTSEAVEGILIL